jgi:hypothetical protein
VTRVARMLNALAFIALIAFYGLAAFWIFR